MGRPEFDKAYDLAMTGQIDPALAIVDAVLAEHPADCQAQLLRIKTLRSADRFAEAEADITRFADGFEASGEPRLRAELAFERGFILNAAGRLDAALARFREAIELAPPKVDYFSAICSVLCRLERYDEATEWRHKILKMRDAEVRCAPHEVITAARPRPFDPARRKRNIISYSLFGNDPYYQECAVTNARISPSMFPEFTARFHCAPDLPESVLKALRAAGAQVLLSRHQQGGRVSPMAGTFWRFLAFDDPAVDVVMCRDVDSPVLPRERAAIDLWLAGTKPFYCLRDHPIHAEVILAGMWGGFTGLLPPLGPLANRFVNSNHSRFADQTFLRSAVWPRLRDHAILSVDSIPSLEGAVDFPPGHPKHGRLHVGCSWTREQIFGPA